ncbi:MAG: hypothetical protein K1X83_15545 [Oligoflexia bacterium]|nr:hypothetical protein [Oligoflexia bacterium]
MTEVSTGLHTQGTVADYFVIESHILSTRTADAYKAVDKSRSMPVCLWMLRHPLALNSEAVKRFLQRINAISEITPAVSDISAYGVDGGGAAFAVFPPLDGQSILSGNLEMAEAERRLTAALRLVDRLHQSGIVCGDLCNSSFWVNRAGDLRLIGVMGSFDSEAVATAMLPPADSIPFFPPEQRSGAGIEPSSDVFSLGVLGYHLLTGRYPYGEGAAALMAQFDINKVAPPSALLAPPPVWGDAVLMQALNPDPTKRFRTAGDMLAALINCRSRAFDAEKQPVRTMRHDAVKVSSSGDGKSGNSQTLHPMPQIAAATEEAVEKHVRRNMSKLLIGSVLGTVLFFALVLPRLSGHGSNPAKGAARSGGLEGDIAALGSDELRQAVNAVSKDSADVNGEHGEELEKIANSDDPLAHQILVKMAMDAKTGELREASEKAIVERARRLGLLRSAEQVRQWLRTVRSEQSESAYEPVLKSLDTTLPPDARSKYIRQAYAVEPDFALRLAAALAVDTGNLDEYQPVISQLVGDVLKLAEASQHSSVALILAEPNLAMIFGEDVIQKRASMPDGDLLWVLRVLADRNDINVRAIASLAVERGVLPPVRAQFLQLIRDRADLPPDVVHALLRAAAGATRVEDISTIGQWYDLQAETVLLAILADNTEKDILTEALDVLAGRSLTIEPSASLVQWVRRKYWSERADFARCIGMLANVDRVKQEDLDKLFDGIDQFAKDGELVELLLGSSSPAVVRSVLAKFGDLVNLGGLLKLLSSPDKEIRISAVKALKSYNDLGALKIIIDHYEKEQDPDVKQAYKDTFWMIKQREE